MNRYLAFTAAAALFASAGIAKADTAEGLVTGIDWERQILTLDTGEAFVVPEHELTQLETGDRVIVNFEERDGQLHAQSVIPGAGTADLGTADPAATADPAMPTDPAATAAPAMPADPAVTADPAVGATADPVLGEAGTVEGRVASIDWERQILRLDTGEEFIAPEHDLTQLETGDYVIVGFEQRDDGQVVAHSVVASQTGDRSSPGDAPGADPSGVSGETQ